MIEIDEHEQISGLLAAYALDATDGEERELVEAHLTNCGLCRGEVDELHDVAGMLGGEGETPPDHLWDRIAADISAAPPSEVATLRPAKSQHLTRSMFRVAVAAAIVLIAGVVALGAMAVRQQHQIDTANQQLVDLREASSLRAAADQAAAQPGTRQIALATAQGATPIEVVVGSDGESYVLPGGTLANLGVRQTYQLWGVADGEAISLGVLGADPTITRLRIPPEVEALAVTIERAPGVVTTKNAPIAQGTI